MSINKTLIMGIYIEITIVRPRNRYTCPHLRSFLPLHKKNHYFRKLIFTSYKK